MLEVVEIEKYSSVRESWEYGRGVVCVGSVTVYDKVAGGKPVPHCSL